MLSSMGLWKNSLKRYIRAGWSYGPLNNEQALYSKAKP
jgi:hypothetical protein